MKKQILLLLLVVCISATTYSQEINLDLKSFDRIIACPKINVVLQQGDQESIKVTYDGVTQDKINIEVHHNTLSVFLENARLIEKNEYENHNYSHGIYNSANVTAYITYKNLNYLEIRGNQELICSSPLEAEVFTLKAYGENQIVLSSIRTSLLKTSLFGENRLTITSGKIYEQQYSIFGENKIDTQNVKSHDAAMNIFGEGKLKITATDLLKVTAFGEPEIHLNGGAHIRKMIFGQAKISRE